MWFYCYSLRFLNLFFPALIQQQMKTYVSEIGSVTQNISLSHISRFFNGMFVS